MQELLDRVDALVADARDASNLPLSEVERLVNLACASASLVVPPQLPLEILLRIAQLVHIPHDFAREEFHDDNDDDNERDDNHDSLLERSTTFRSNSTRLLQLSTRLWNDMPRTPPLEPHQVATLFVAYTRFLQPAFSTRFSDPELRKVSSNLVSILLDVDAAVRISILTYLVRTTLPTRFKPHPHVNPHSGRVLSRPLGGTTGRARDAGSELAEEGSGWKTIVGLSGVVLTIIQSLDDQQVEDLWPWLLPPVLSFLDDHDPRNKIQGLDLLDELLNKTSRSLLVRTGVGKVFQQSLEVVFSNLSDPLSPILLETAHPVALKLVQLVYPTHQSLAVAAGATNEESKRKASEARFEAMCRYFEHSILKSWEYKSGQFEIERVAVRALERWIAILQNSEGGEGGSVLVRYFGILAPHLVDLLLDSTTRAASHSKRGELSRDLFQLRSSAITIVAKLLTDPIGSKRWNRWQPLIVSRVAKSWVEVRELQCDNNDKSRSDLARRAQEAYEQELRNFVRLCLQDLDHQQHDRWKELRELDPIFHDLVPEF
ncbi:uncharacterized protein JCM15063_001984 [Sporobolomyces koalae]|uniref:uncharacterized protein n=1 Tax=Sporobolomyces koalae TaxID=500713 RepID=UPI00317425B3